jgi:hypothetical protein
LIKRIIILSFAITCWFQYANAQTGGDNTYEFLNLPNAARIGALGGNNISLYANDLNIVYHNPSLLRASMDGKLVLNYINYIADINFGYVSYAHHLEGIGTFGVGIHYLNYGNFIHADETGTILGDFTASEYSFNLYYSREIYENLYAGATLKTIYSALSTYYSSGMAIDAGITWLDTANLFSAALVLKNFGVQFKPYQPGNKEPMPYDLQLGLTKGLQHAPFRVSVTFQNLFNWSLRYDSPLDAQNILDDNVNLADSTFGQKFNTFLNKTGNVGDELLRHVILGVEFVPSDNFYIAFGFNYRRRSELALQTRAAIVGMSFGAGINLSKFNIHYGLASYHLAGMSHHMSLGLNLNAFYKKTSSM